MTETKLGKVSVSPLLDIAGMSTGDYQARSGQRCPLPDAPITMSAYPPNLVKNGPPKSQQAYDIALAQSLLVNVVISLIAFVLFSILRTRFKCIYEPRSQRSQPSSAQYQTKPTIFGWLKPSLLYDEAALWKTHGLDTVMYFKFLRALIMIGVAVFVASLPISVVDVTATRKDLPLGNSSRVSGTAVITIANIDVSDSGEKWRLLAHAASLVFNTIACCWIFRRLYAQFAHLQLGEKSRIAPENFTVRLDGVGEAHSVDDLFRYFESLVPGETIAVHRVPDLDKTRTLIYRRKSIKDPAKFAAINQHISSSLENPAPTNTVYATFRSHRSQLVCSRVPLHIGLHEKWQAKPAVAPSDVLWENHSGYSPLSRLLRRLFVKAMTAVMILFFSIPTAFAAGLANITTLSKVPGYRWLQTIVDMRIARGFIEGFLASVIIFVSFELLLLLLRLLASFQVHRTRSNHVRVVLRHFFVFQVVNIFLASLLAGTFLSITYELVLFVMEPIEIVWLLAERLPGQVNYFVGYIVLNSVIRHIVALLRPLDLIFYGIKRLCRKTSSDDKNPESPELHKFDFAYFVASDLLVFLIVITYSTLAPLITSVFALLYFALAYLSARYNLIWVARQQYQAWGSLWPDIYHCIMVSIVLYQLTLFGVFALNTFPPGAAMCLVCLIGTIVCWRSTHRQHATIMKFGAFDIVELKGVVLPSDIDTDSAKAPQLTDSDEESGDNTEKVAAGGEEDDQDLFTLCYMDPLLKTNYPHQTID